LVVDVILQVESWDDKSNFARGPRRSRGGRGGNVAILYGGEWVDTFEGGKGLECCGSCVNKPPKGAKTRDKHPPPLQ
jgi:hypothetical protein